MFRISCFVEDRRLSQVLRMLATAGVGNVETVPVTTEDVARAAAPDSPKPRKGRIDPAALGLRKGDRFDVTSLKVALEKMGRSPDSYWAIVSRMMRGKEVRRISDGHYEVIK